MKKISDLINKDVVDIALAKHLGKALYVHIAEGKMSGISTEQGFVPVQKLISVGEVITANLAGVLTSADGQPLPRFGAKVINAKGRYLGVVKDYDYTDTYIVKYIELENKRISAMNVTSMSDEYLVFSNHAKQHATPSIPTIVADYSFLIGRRLSRNILTKDKKMLIPEGVIVTKEHVEKAKNHSKLVDLTLYSSPIK